MASLQLTFSDVYSKVGEFLGWITPGGTLTGTDLANAKNVVHRGYRRFLYSVDLRTGKGHIWSFMQEFKTLETVPNQWIYNLPADYDRLVMGFIHESDSGYPPMARISPEMIYQMRAGGESSSYPHYYAIRPGRYVKEIGTTYEVIFFETPNSVYELNYSYSIRPPQLSATTDLFLGGDFASEVILEHCLAVAEQEYDDTRGIHSQTAQELTQQLIEADHPIVADHVGKNLDTNIRKITYERPLPLTLTENVYP